MELEDAKLKGYTPCIVCKGGVDEQGDQSQADGKRGTFPMEKGSAAVRRLQRHIAPWSN